MSFDLTSYVPPTTFTYTCTNITNKLYTFDTSLIVTPNVFSMSQKDNSYDLNAYSYELI